MAKQTENKHVLHITTTGENFTTDAQTPQQIQELSQKLFASTAARRPVRIPRDGTWRWFNTHHVYSWYTIDAETGEAIPNA